MNLDKVNQTVDELPKGKKWRVIWIVVGVSVLVVIAAIAF